MKHTIPDWLRQHLLFADMNDAQFAKVADTLQRYPLQAGDELFGCGDTARRFFLVESGVVNLYRLSPAGGEKVIELIQARQSFAEALMFMERAVFPVSARAVQPSMVLGFAMDAYRTVLATSPALCQGLLGSMSRRLHQLLGEIDDLSLQNASMRVAQLLLRAAPSGAARNYTVQWETPKQVLASRVSVRPETFSRILQQLARAGLIRTDGKTVDVLDADGVRAWAETR